MSGWTRWVWPTGFWSLCQKGSYWRRFCRLDCFSSWVGWSAKPHLRLTEQTRSRVVQRWHSEPRRSTSCVIGDLSLHPWSEAKWGYQPSFLQPGQTSICVHTKWACQPVSLFSRCHSSHCLARPLHRSAAIPCCLVWCFATPSGKAHIASSTRRGRYLSSLLASE